MEDAVHDLESVAGALVAKGKGILAADESTATITKRLGQVGIESTDSTRCAYRELLFTTPDIEDCISGVILYDETIRQAVADGRLFPEVLADRGIVAGIKVDHGAKDLAGFPGERVTEGLDGLADRLEEYRSLGARFAKWRAVIAIADSMPTPTCLEANAHALARYAKLCQTAGLVPIVEPEVLMDGGHDISRCESVTRDTLARVFAALRDHHIDLEGMLLKPNMVLSGKQCPTQASVDEVARATLRCFREVVPAAVTGIVFLSGGQSPQQATEHLDAIRRWGDQPWEISFSYGRALQEPSLSAWRGEMAKVHEAQGRFRHRAVCNSAARDGRYSADMERTVE